VVVQRGKLEIMDKIYFETDKDEILPRSFPLLDQIAGTIKGHPEIKLIEIQGHADERGDDEHNLDLTDRRAKSVMRGTGRPRRFAWETEGQGLRRNQADLHAAQRGLLEQEPPRGIHHHAAPG